ncbi:S8 family serine peptidase [Nonomuraea sp. NN258]|uniref:S8 family peptidase n=1 Tax=Nonomuraea antri TaxID=2730852 RepID=UPI00156A5C24|nr:S8 family serine peptidase [Nonomuraea antri]NRQ38063.1 S8 family serine peptidase [Nonomuraea antri]
MIGRALLASVATALPLLAAPTAAQTASALGVRAAPADCDPPKGVTRVPGGEPWAQQRLDIKGAWRLTMGKGVTVAVVDSGVDYKHPQLRLAKFIDETSTGFRDCVGHGTAVTGIIGARYTQGVPFHGVAPEVRLVMVKQSNAQEGEVATLVKAIEDAVRAKPDVINVSVRASDTPQLKAAVENALAQDIVVVAAAGNVTNEDDEEEPAYPAAYPGVLAVGAATPDGRRADSSNAATPVDVLAPGTEIIAPWPGGTYQRGLEGTSFAAPYVTGTAALVRARFPKLSQEQVQQRIVATADGTAGRGTGAGMVNPLLAVTAVLPFEPAGSPVVAAPPPEPLAADAIAKVPPPDEAAVNVSMTVGAGALGAAAVAGALAWLIPLGRRRGWRSGRPD